MSCSIIRSGQSLSHRSVAGSSTQHPGQLSPRLLSIFNASSMAQVANGRLASRLNAKPAISGRHAVLPCLTPALPTCQASHHALGAHHQGLPRPRCTGIVRSSASMAFPSDGNASKADVLTSLPEPQTPAPITSTTPGQPTINIFDRIRGLIFFAWSFMLAIPLFITMCCMAPFVIAFDKYRRLAQHFVNNIWAMISTSLFYPVEVVGKENLPPPEKPVVYVANHQSFLDIYSLFHLQRPFKFISKASIFLIPIVGWSMFLTGHVSLNRVDRRSQLECLKQCGQLLQQSAPVLFFPEGTRSVTRVMSGFKKGAFSVAVKAGVDVVPITLIGTGDLMPSGKEGVLRKGAVKIIVHKPIPTKGRKADEVCDESRAIIAASLPPELQGSATDMTPDE